MSGIFGDNDYDKWLLNELESQSEGPEETEAEKLYDRVYDFVKELDSDVDLDLVDDKFITLKVIMGGDPDYHCDQDLGGVLEDIQFEFKGELEFLGDDYDCDSDWYHEASFKIKESA